MRKRTATRFLLERLEQRKLLAATPVRSDLAPQPELVDAASLAQDKPTLNLDPAEVYARRKQMVDDYRAGRKNGDAHA